MSYIKVASESELPGQGEAREFEIDGKAICIANVGGTITAMDNFCLHMGGPLGQGYIEGNKVVCPWHGWEYDPKTGQLEDDPKTRIPVYPIKIENGEAFVDL